jgi:uncharacterized membrane protein YczE
VTHSILRPLSCGQQGTNYIPVIAIFAVSALFAFAVQFSQQHAWKSYNSVLIFFAVAMLLAGAGLMIYLHTV